MKVTAPLWRTAAFVSTLVGILLWSIVPAYSDVSVMVSAVVGTGNAYPEVLAVNPNTVPVVLGKGTIQTFSVQVRDTDSSSVSYTITAGTGATNPISGTLGNATDLASGQAYVYFTYYAPTNKAGSSNITVTLNDGSAVVVKNIGIYVY